MLYESIKKGQQAALQDSIEPGQVSRLEPKLPIATSTLQAASDEHGSKNTFVAREAELEKLNRFLDMALDGRGLPIFVTGSAGQGKTVLMQEFALRAQKRIPDLLVASGKCNAQTGIGDP